MFVEHVFAQAGGVRVLFGALQYRTVEVLRLFVCSILMFCFVGGIGESLKRKTKDEQAKLKGKYNLCTLRALIGPISVVSSLVRFFVLQPTVPFVTSFSVRVQKLFVKI